MRAGLPNYVYFGRSTAGIRNERAPGNIVRIYNTYIYIYRDTVDPSLPLLWTFPSGVSLPPVYGRPTVEQQQQQQQSLMAARGGIRRQTTVELIGRGISFDFENTPDRVV